MGVIWGVCKELLSFIIALVTYPLGLFHWDLISRRASSGSVIDRPILLIHGYLHNGSAWIFHRKALQKAGFGSIYTLNLGSPFHSIEEYSEVVRQKVLHIQQDSGRNDLILIGHSMGGLVASYYATQVAPENVTHVITLGSPLDGTRVASLGFGKCSLQMRHQSPFVKGLQHEISQHPHIRFLHLSSEDDLFIRPQQSANLLHKNGQNKVYPHRGHFSYLYSLEVAHDVHRFLFKDVSNLGK